MAEKAPLDPWLRKCANEYCNWTCIVCDKVALDPVKLQAQSIVNRSVMYTDSDGSIWLKCVRCQIPIHLACTNTTALELANKTRYLCEFLNCETEEFEAYFLTGKPPGPKY